MILRCPIPGPSGMVAFSSSDLIFVSDDVIVDYAEIDKIGKYFSASFRFFLIGTTVMTSEVGLGRHESEDAAKRTYEYIEFIKVHEDIKQALNLKK